ncbi:uncharacterized protein F4817DRAFT_260892 [Daldinia loculata]|uniref:uncharacterized protein n=1 Tax=Daldinia loculata TaxID=103429 RepID=UPI0020C28DFB|nr:uncharacterized protein F4817DRAFT_260892 [Daldinia loculata]KAI1650415.1 hypothetical protein F4817DRAFT_260892 [Daldinia loculata]
MVVRTTSLNSLKRFLPKIHQPLPLTPRESQQMLDSITTSFRKNLDKEHPWEHHDDITSQTSIPQNKKPTFSTSLPSSSSSLDTPGQQHPTDRHLRDILSNPLFSHQSKKKLPSASRDPLDVFDSAVSRGLMTPQRAVGFLAKVRSQIGNGSADDIRRGMAESGAGLRVVQWLRASGLENDMQFSSNSTLFAALIPFMYAEGLEEVAWTWVARLSICDKTHDIKKLHISTLSALLFAILNQTCHTYSGVKTSLDSSYEAIIRANDILPKQNEVALKSFRKAWAGLSWISTVCASERPKPSAPLFESFVDIGRPWKMPMDMAHLELHHPLVPNHSAAVQFLHNSSDSSNLYPSTRRRLVCLALDTADRLKEVGDTDEVSWVERFLLRIGDDLNFGIFNAPGKDLIASKLPIYRMM